MSRAMSSGVAGLDAHQTAIDIIGNNIANVNTYGFRAGSAIFRDVLYQEMGAASAANTTTGAGGINPSQIGYGSKVSTIVLDTGRAGMSTTGRTMDCYINGEGYFVVGTGKDTAVSAYEKPTGYQYTRVGSLNFDDEGYLTDGNGVRVCGQQNTAAAGATATYVPSDLSADAPGYIRRPVTTVSGKTTVDKLSDISISADGTITATNTNKQVITIGKIALATFTNPSGLTMEGNSYYQVSGNSGEASYTTPGKDASGTLTTSALEASNVNLAKEFANMIQFERGFQANSKIISVSDEMMETLVNLKR